MRVVQRGAVTGVIVAAVLLLPEAVDAQQYLADSKASSGTIVASGPNDNQLKISTTTPVAVNATSQTLSVNASASAAASGAATTEAGAVRASSFASAQTNSANCCSSAGAASSSTAVYDDFFFLSAPSGGSLTGALFGTAFINLSGLFGGTVLGSNATGGASYRASLIVNNDSWVWGGSTSKSINGEIRNGDEIANQIVSIALTPGQNNRVRMSLETWANANAGGVGLSDATFNSNLMSTFSWGGITSLTANGVEVQDYSAIGNMSAFDFKRGFQTASPVPEPATWAMLLFGFGMIGSALRRRRRFRSVAPAI